MTCLEKLHDRLVQGSNAAEERSKGIGFLEAAQPELVVSRRAQTECALQMARHYSTAAPPALYFVTAAASGADLDVPPLAQLAAEPAAVEGQHEHAVELYVRAVRGRSQAR